MNGPYRRTQGGPRCHGPTFDPGVVVDTDSLRVVKISDTGVSFSTKNFAKMSVFLVKTLKICWRLGGLPPDPLSIRRLGASPPDPRLWPPFAKS